MEMRFVAGHFCVVSRGDRLNFWDGKGGDIRSWIYTVWHALLVNILEQCVCVTLVDTQIGIELQFSIGECM